MQLKQSPQSCKKVISKLVEDGYKLLDCIEASFEKELDKAIKQRANYKPSGGEDYMQHAMTRLPSYHLVSDQKIAEYENQIDKWIKKIVKKFTTLFDNKTISYKLKLIEHEIESFDFTDGGYFTDESNFAKLKSKIIERIKFLLKLDEQIASPVLNAIIFDARTCTVFFKNNKCAFKKEKFAGRLLKFMFTRQTGEPFGFDTLYQALQSDSDKEDVDLIGFTETFAEKLIQTYKDINRRTNEKLKVQLLIKEGSTLRVNSNPHQSHPI